MTPNLYRGAQPTAAGMAELSRLGVRTVVNLRKLSSDRDLMGALPLDYEHLGMTAWDPDDEEVVAFLKIATDPARQPVFVHCKHGADRTGLVVAVYRVVVEGWSKQAAIREMTDGGYGFHSIWQNLVRYLEKLDVERIRQEAGLE
ncbi:MAG: tyrosine-protein phosphatase [Deltaproteobacteria bacterium]|nr:tyrosine-protein phosphatase [Deltaproteobacteria bacterium]MBW2535718.1 tyrosine-protein phosphatase [Deltaproteobacteria bacterium]